MANVYADFDLATGLNDGTSWANAYQTPIFTAAAGDDIWMKGSHSQATDMFIDWGGTDGNPVRVHGVKSATTNEPPVQSDLIPGWRTGEARTTANRAYNDADSPLIQGTSTGGIFLRSGTAYIYGVRFQTAGDFIDVVDNSSADQRMLLEECGFILAVTDLQATSGTNGGTSVATLLNCGFNFASGVSIGAGFGTTLNIIGAEMYGGAVPTNLVTNVNSKGYINFVGCDFSGITGTLIESSSENVVNFQACSLNAAVTVMGTRTNVGRATLSRCSSVTGKSSGSLVNLTISSVRGDILHETTAVRTGGASDGQTAHSWAMTPIANFTRDNYQALVSPPIAAWLAGNGASKTVTVYIANSGAGDYQDDEVWLEVQYVSPSGTAQSENETLQMDLLGTASTITDDTSSTWGTGASNPQKLVATVAPDYHGPVYVRIHFAKNFAASPETLYVDPNVEIA